jgi:hypothetical protein
VAYIVVPLERAELETLICRAKAARRTPKEQAAYLLAAALAAPANSDTDPYARRDQQELVTA